jgi:hypothetical protein
MSVGALIEHVAKAGLRALLAQDPVHLLNLFGRLQNFRDRLLGRFDDVVELFGGGEQLVRRFDRGYFAPCARDGLAHLDELTQHLVLVPALWPKHRQLELGDRIEQHLGVRSSIAACIFGEELAAVHRVEQYHLDRGVIGVDLASCEVLCGGASSAFSSTVAKPA